MDMLEPGKFGTAVLFKKSATTISSAVNVGRRGARHFAEDLAGDGCDVLEVLVVHRRNRLLANCRENKLGFF